MPSTTVKLEALVRQPCARCERETAFWGQQELCPHCRAEDLERECGLRPGLFRELVTLSSRGLEQSEKRRRRPIPLARSVRRKTGRVVGVA